MNFILTLQVRKLIPDEKLFNFGGFFTPKFFIGPLTQKLLFVTVTVQTYHMLKAIQFCHKYNLRLKAEKGTNKQHKNLVA